MIISDEINSRLTIENIVIRERINSENKTLDLLKNSLRNILSNNLPDVDPFFNLRNKIFNFGYSGRNCRIRSGFRCTRPENIYILDEVFINYSCIFLANENIFIGRNVAIGPSVGIYTINHFLGPDKKFESRKEPVYIDDNCWIGGHAVILPGVKVAQGSIIGAGAVVTRNTKEGGIYAGVPARRIN